MIIIPLLEVKELWLYNWLFNKYPGKKPILAIPPQSKQETERFPSASGKESYFKYVKLSY